MLGGVQRPAASTLVILAAVAVLAATAGHPAAAGPHRGRIVRVERPRTGGSGLVRVCRMNDPGSATCWGRPPVKEELAWVVGPETQGHKANRGQVRIKDVTASDLGCSVATNWTVALDAADADLGDLDAWQYWLVLDVDMGPEARSVDTGQVKSPDERQTPWIAINRGRGEADSGSSDADFVVTAYSCDQNGLMSQGSTSGYCLDYFLRSSGRWSLLRHDTVVPDASCPNP